MNMTLTVEGSLEVRKLLQDLGEKASPALQGALYEEGTALLNDADKLVPRDTGNLAASKFIDIGSEAFPEVTVGYGGAASPYALLVHENPRSGKTGGVGPPPNFQKYQHWAAVGEWKFLETPFKARMTGFASRIAASLKSRLLKGS